MAARRAPLQTQQFTDQAERPRAKCDTAGCEQPAFNRVDDKNLCQACEERIRHEQAEAFCRSKGLDTVEARRAYCRQLVKRIGREVSSFERWARAITQKTVDRLALMDWTDDRKVLERLRDAGAIDEENRLIPLERRAAARAEREAARKAERSWMTDGAR